jgi:hypothetical protein
MNNQLSEDISIDIVENIIMGSVLTSDSTKDIVLAEIWTPIKINLPNESVHCDGFFNKYEVSNYGVIRNRHTYKIYMHTNEITSTDNKAYCKINLNQNGVYASYSISHIVMSSFYYSKYTMGCNIYHVDKDVSNNRLDNLKILTSKEIMEEVIKTKKKI